MRGFDDKSTSRLSYALGVIGEKERSPFSKLVLTEASIVHAAKTVVSLIQASTQI
jgi:hypothetical protein